MKACSIFIFAVAFLALASANEDPERRLPENLKSTYQKCSEKNAITPKALCIYHEIGIQNLNGDIDKESLKTNLLELPHITAEQVDKLLAECGERKGDTAGDAANALQDCLEKTLREPGNTTHGR